IAVVEDVVIRMIPADFRAEDEILQAVIVRQRRNRQAERDLFYAGVQSAAAVIVVEVFGADIEVGMRAEFLREIDGRALPVAAAELAVAAKVVAFARAVAVRGVDDDRGIVA